MVILYVVLSISLPSRRESAFNTLIEKIIELSRSFISKAGFNLIYMFPVDSSEPENAKSNSSTSAFSCFNELQEAQLIDFRVDLFSCFTSHAGFTLRKLF